AARGHRRVGPSPARAPPRSTDDGGAGDAASGRRHLPGVRDGAAGVGTPLAFTRVTEVDMDVSAGQQASPSQSDAAFARAGADLCPGWHVVEVRTLDADAGAADGDTHKSAGYGAPRRVRLADDDGRERSLVFHVATANEFGHDRRADRAAEQLLAFDTFARIPRHVRALDVGALGPRGLVSLGDVGELYLVSEWADGAPYAEDLRRIARTATVTPLGLARCDALAEYLVALHRRRDGTPAQYRRALRDVVGSGEGIFGIRDAYGDDTPGAPGARLDAIEARCLGWR